MPTAPAVQLKNGDLCALSVASAKRFEKLPDVPTVIESGYNDEDQQSWNDIFAPVKTPHAVFEQLQKLFGDAGRSEDIKNKIAVQGLLPDVKCGADLKANLQQQYDLLVA